MPAREFDYPNGERNATVRAFTNPAVEKDLHAFTLIELFVVIGVIAILLSLAFPVFNTVQEKARVAQDLNNLRQLGIATQTYLNDNDETLFSSDATVVWMKSLHPKYLPNWKIFQSPFDKRASSEDDAIAPVSYGFNGNSVLGLSSDTIARPSAFILIAPTQTTASTVSFSGNPSNSVTVYKASSVPGGTAIGGTHNHRTRINALFADLHVDSLTWSDFLLDQDVSNSQADANFRWDYAGHP